MNDEINAVNSSSKRNLTDLESIEESEIMEPAADNFDMSVAAVSMASLMKSYQFSMKQLGKQLKFRYRKIINAYNLDTRPVVHLYFSNSHLTNNETDSTSDQLDRRKSACAYTGRFSNYDFILDRYYERSELTEILFYETYVGFKNTCDFLLKIAHKNSWDVEKRKIVPSRIVISGNEFLDNNILFEARDPRKLELVLQNFKVQHAIMQLLLYPGKFYILENGIYHKAEFDQMTNQKLIKTMQSMVDVGKALDKAARSDNLNL